jgi:hypothetical protein
MSEILTAITLLMTVAMILYGLWHKEMVRACQIEVKSYHLDNKANRLYVWQMYVSQALPLTLLTAFTALIFTPEVLRIVVDAFGAFQRHGLLAVRQYSSVNTAFLLVQLAVGWLAWHAGGISKQLYRKWQLLGRGQEAPGLPNRSRPRS